MRALNNFKAGGPKKTKNKSKAKQQTQTIIKSGLLPQGPAPSALYAAMAAAMFSPWVFLGSRPPFSTRPPLEMLKLKGSTLQVHPPSPTCAPNGHLPPTGNDNACIPSAKP